MSQQEFVLRLVLAGIGLVVMLSGVVLKYLRPSLEVTPFTLIGLGFLCIVTSTDGAD